jgi:hypothetical protein
MMKKTALSLTLAVSFVLLVPKVPGQESNYGNVPSEIGELVTGGHFGETYDLMFSLNPFYLRGDFDGDGKPDYALRIRSKKDGKTGIAIWLSGLRRFVILGAGVPWKFGDSIETDLDWMDLWQVYAKQPIERGVEAGPPPKLIGEAILAAKSESGSGLIYWNGKRFAWYQQGD